MRFYRLLTALSLVAFTACLPDATEPSNWPDIPIEQTSFAPALGVNLSASTKTASGMYIRDITVGTGATLAVNDSVGVYYSGNLANGQLFDERKPNQAAFGFRVGKRQVIGGWDEGVVGMKVGGVRQLIIPHALGYGPYQNGPIPPYSVLVFTVTAAGIIP